MRLEEQLDRCCVIFRFPRLELSSLSPARREWEATNGKQLQVIDRYNDHARDEIVFVYEVLGTRQLIVSYLEDRGDET